MSAIRQRYHAGAIILMRSAIARGPEGTSVLVDSENIYITIIYYPSAGYYISVVSKINNIVQILRIAVPGYYCTANNIRHSG